MCVNDVRCLKDPDVSLTHMDKGGSVTGIKNSSVTVYSSVTVLRSYGKAQLLFLPDAFVDEMKQMNPLKVAIILLSKEM